MTVLHEGMRKAPSEGKSVVEWPPRPTGGIGGRPGVRMCAVCEGSRLGALLLEWARLPGPDPDWVGPAAPFAEAVLLTLYSGGE